MLNPYKTQICLHRAWLWNTPVNPCKSFGLRLTSLFSLQNKNPQWWWMSCCSSSSGAHDESRGAQPKPQRSLWVLQHHPASAAGTRCRHPQLSSSDCHGACVRPQTPQPRRYGHAQIEEGKKKTLLGLLSSNFDRPSPQVVPGSRSACGSLTASCPMGKWPTPPGCQWAAAAAPRRSVASPQTKQLWGMNTFSFPFTMLLLLQLLFLQQPCGSMYSLFNKHNQQWWPTLRGRKSILILYLVKSFYWRKTKKKKVK